MDISILAFDFYSETASGPSEDTMKTDMIPVKNKNKKLFILAALGRYVLFASFLSMHQKL